MKVAAKSMVAKSTHTKKMDLCAQDFQKRNFIIIIIVWRRSISLL